VNTATITDDGSNGPDPNPGDNTATDTDTLNAAPDLVVAKDDGVLVARPGDLLTYTVTVRNAGNQGATGVALTDALPANVSFVSTTGGGAHSNGVVTWAVGNLAAGASVSFTVTVRVNATVPAGQSALTNTATATDDGTNGPDPTPGTTRAPTRIRSTPPPTCTSPRPTG
jgi:large repetitive protein